MLSNVLLPPASAKANLFVVLPASGNLRPNHPFYQLIEETRQGFLSSNDILEYIAASTFVDNEPTPQSQLVRMGEIQTLLRHKFPMIVATVRAAIGGGLRHDAGPGVRREEMKVCGVEHVIYIDQRMVEGCLEKSWLKVDHRPLLTFLLKLILLREITIAAWSMYGSHSHLSDKRSSTPFAEPTDVFVSGCGHLYLGYQGFGTEGRESMYRELRSIVFLNEEGGYIEIPETNTPILRKLASGDWSVFQRDVITSIGPYQKTTFRGDRLKPLWEISCHSCSKFC